MPRTDDPPGARTDDAAALAAFLRRLAEALERDDALGRHLAELVRESGLLVDAHAERPAAETPIASRRRAGQAGVDATASAVAPPAVAPPDPFALLRERGEPGLRAARA